MITPRRTRLLRAPDLAGYRSHLVEVARTLDPAAAGDAFVLVPTRAAAEQLTRTLEDRLLEPGAARVWPHAGSRGDLYDLLRERLPAPPRWLTPFEREAMLAAAAREAEDAGAAPPFHLRPALMAEMLALYDHVRRLDRTVDDFERVLASELEPAAESDRGALQLLEQTRFLAAAFRSYEQRLTDGGGVDEHAARQRLIAEPSPRPLRRLIIAVGDRPFDPDGFWPADASLFTTLPGLEQIDILATDAVLDAGYLERLQLAFVELEHVGSEPSVLSAALSGSEPSAPSVPLSGSEPSAPSVALGGSAPSAPSVALGGSAPSAAVLVTPDTDSPAFTYRDREDELEGVARRLKADRRAGRGAPLHRTALIVSQPLPYLYLAREVFAGARVPFEALDTLPLAAEPYAAAVDVVLECAAANFTRRAAMALLRSPHFRFVVDDLELDRTSVAALDTVMAEQRYLGGLDRLTALAETWTGEEGPAARTVVAIALELSPLLEPRPLVDQIELLRAFLDRHDREHQERRRRVKVAVMDALTGLADAYRRHDPAATGTVTELSAAVRRWLGAQTFVIESGQGGLQILDTQAARFADIDDGQLMGLVEGEWPERPRRNIFYPRSLIAQLEPSRPERVTLDQERDQIRYARAMFRDLLCAPRRRTRVSTFALESESVVEPSSFIEDLPAFGLTLERAAGEDTRVFAYEALVDSAPSVLSAALVADRSAAWAEVRRTNAEREPMRFQGEAGEWTLPRVSVSRLERYLKCPFQFYVANVLQVPEEPEDEISRSPLDRGRFLHELFETFFHEWQARGHSRISAANMAEARALFEEVAGPALRSLSPSEAGLERAKLFGSAAGSGIADRVFAMEAERGVEIRQRLMEYELDGEFTFAGEDGGRRNVRLRGKIDRVDLLGDGTFRLIDYKTKYVPDRRLALQLPVYSACVRTTLSAEHRRDVAPSEAMYLSFEGPQAIVALEERGKTFDELTAAAGHRLVAALDDIAAGHYPPRPETRNLCTMCSFVAVCRTPGGAADGAEPTRAAEGAESSDPNA